MPNPRGAERREGIRQVFLADCTTQIGLEGRVVVCPWPKNQKEFQSESEGDMALERHFSGSHKNIPNPTGRVYPVIK